MQGNHLLSSTVGIVLAGTFPWTKSAFERLAPRPLLPVTHRPLIGFSLSWLERGGVSRAAVCTNRNSRAIADQLAASSALRLDVDFFEDPMPRGAAGCARDAALAAGGEHFVVSDAASIPNVSLVGLLEQHCATGAAVTVATYQENPGLGQAPLQVPSGVYVLSRQAIDTIARHGFADIKEHLLPALARAGARVNTFAGPVPVPRVLDAATYLAVNELMIRDLAQGRSTLPDYDTRGEALVHRDARIGADATIVGPVVVAAGARIDGDAVVVGPSTVGTDAVVEGGALVSRSTVWRRATIRSGAVVDRTIVGDGGDVAAWRQVYRTVVPGADRRRSEDPGGAVPSPPRSAA